MTVWSLLAWMLLAQSASPPFVIQVVDAATGEGVPLVTLEMTDGGRFLTDSAGMVSFQEPGLMNQEVWFDVSSHGYEYPADVFGLRGVRLQTEPGGQAVIKLPRVNIAERVCRLSGSGIYRDSVLAGKLPGEKGLLLRARTMGYDSVQSTVYRDQIYWFWGDTARLSYPLGNFHMTGATSPLPTEDALAGDPYLLAAVGSTQDSNAPGVRRGLEYKYFTGPDGFVKGVCPMTGDGPTWLDALTVLTNYEGVERMYAAYAKIKPPLDVYRRGFCVWNDQREQFEPVSEFAVDAPVIPFGHPQRLKEGDVEYIVFGDPFPNVRVRAEISSFLNPGEYEGFTPLQPGSRIEDQLVERDSSGNVVYGWKRSTPPLSPADEHRWIAEGLLPATAARWQLRETWSQKFVEAHRGSVNWNAYRRKWILVATQIGGTSQLGEVWYAEAPQPTGPWDAAVKIISHQNYSFYNPFQHRTHDARGGRIIHIEGTYTNTFAGDTPKTPRYDYNQMLYRLDLSDARLHP